MISILKSTGAVFAGLVVAVAPLYACEAIGHRIWPLPEGVDPKNLEALRAAIAGMPVGAFVSILAGWAIGSIGGGFLAGILAPGRRVLHAVLLGAVSHALGIMTMLTIPHPAWFRTPSLLAFIPPAALGGCLAARCRRK